jgi:hypothetical protein
VKERKLYWRGRKEERRNGENGKERGRRKENKLALG